MSNDLLLIASGGRKIRKPPGIENAIIPCGGIIVTEAVRDWLVALKHGTVPVSFDSNPNEPSAVLVERRPAAVFKPELICVVDTLDAGMLVFRDTGRNVVPPRLAPFHAVKCMFEARYLKAYRAA